MVKVRGVFESTVSFRNHLSQKVLADVCTSYSECYLFLTVVAVLIPLLRLVNASRTIRNQNPQEKHQAHHRH